MNKITAATLFTGGGLADIGMKQAGLDVRWGLEYDPEIAEHAMSQLGTRLYTMDILDANPKDFEKVDSVHTSPPCPRFSMANSNKGETDLDIAMAQKTADFIIYMKPRWFTLENVWQYRKSASWAIISAALDQVYTPFMWRVDNLNSADFGVPQTRKRMIVRACLDGVKPLPEKEEWKGWYQAIEDLIPDLLESEFAPWQLKRLKDHKVIGSFLTNPNTTTKNTERQAHEPAPTVGAKVPGKQVAYLVEGSAGGNRAPSVMAEDEPAFTVLTSTGGRVHRIFLMSGGNSTSKVVRGGQEPAPTIRSGRTDPSTAHIGDGKVVKISPRCAARFQTLPDWYELPKKKTLAMTIIGNGVPCLMMEKIVRSMIK